MLNLTDVIMFVAVYDEGGYVAAAMSLGYTHSALPPRIARLGRMIGGPLFVRDGQGMRPTKHAYRIIEPCREMLRAVESCEVTIIGKKKENVIPELL